LSGQYRKIDETEIAGGMSSHNRIFQEIIKIDIVKNELCFIILLVRLKMTLSAAPLKPDLRPGQTEKSGMFYPGTPVTPWW